jgi:hypothetical protein
MTLETKKIRPYVGIKKDGTREVFPASQGPTEELYGDLYSAVIGPFKTKRGANFMAQYGAGNPHLQTVEDAERIARQEEKKELAARKPQGKPVNIDCTELHTWFERDRAHVELRSKLDDKTIVEWWDDADSAAIGDGFLNPRDYHQTAYDYAKEHGMLPIVLPHYIAMSGQHGCLPDHCEVFESKKDAVQDLGQLFELGRTRAARLRKDSYLELTPNPIEERQGEDFGAEYCEITECDCDNPLVHSDSR